MRKIEIEGASLPNLKDNELISKSYEFKLISPMFGGDTESFVINKKVPVRSQSIKGQLRFWWRTMQGESNSRELLQKEGTLWGASLQEKYQSRIKVSVSNFKDLSFVPVTAKRNPRSNSFCGLESNDLASYVLFPITQKVKNDETVELLQQARFTLNLTFPKDCKDDAMNSLLLWALFGGVGGRTRRGCGSVYSEALLRDMGVDSIEKVAALVDRLGQGGTAELEYARLKGATLYCNKTQEKSVKKLQEEYGAYRQARKPDADVVGRYPHPGRSYWPEPDSIRLLSGKWADLHTPRHPDANQKNSVWFPRAVFGLPVMTRFNTQENGMGDPEGNWKLEPEGKERWPSSCFIKKVCISDVYYDVLLVLNQKYPSKLVLKDDRRREYPVPASAMPANTKGKTMVKDPSHPEWALNGRSIFKALADALNLKEVK